MSSSATVIDRLIVTLGLDPKNFKKGEKEAAAALVDLKKKAKETGDEVEKSGERSGDSWMAAGRKFLVVAAVFKVLSYTTKNILAAADATYDLSNAARQLDTSAKYLRNFENVAEIMGGTADGARKTIAGLHAAIANKSLNGEISTQLVQLARLGVRFEDAGGHMRDFKDIYLDTAQKIQEARASTGMTEGEALELLGMAGFDPGLARAAVGGRDSAAAALARQEARRQISGEDINAATGSMQALTSANQAKDAAFVHAQTGAAGTIQRIAGAKEGLFNAGNTGEISQAWEAVTAALEPASTGLANLAESAGEASDNLIGWARRLAGKGRSGYESQIQTSAKKYGLDPELLAGVLHTESRFDPNAVSAAGARGIAQLMPQFFPGAGVDPMKDIDTAAEYLSRLHASFIKTGSSDGDAWDKALMSYNGGEHNVRHSPGFGDGVGDSTPLTGETTAYPGQVYEYAAAHSPGGGAPTTVQIDEINVHTAATDAQGIASGIGGAMQRKLGAAQAEQGMQ